MRRLNSDIADKINQKIQTVYSNSNPQAELKIMRNIIPLTQSQFIERKKIKQQGVITDSGVAIKHTKFQKDDEEIWIAYIEDGNLKIAYAENEELLNRTSWTQYSFSTSAEACAIAFDSHVRRGIHDVYEFITDEVPWVFWVEDGALKAKLCTPLGIMIHTLAENNVTDVSAVRGCSGEYGSWDFGLTVFFLVNGNLYYRQLIDEVWYDAELIQNIPSGITISKIAAFNTWDYRVGVQLLTSSGDLYELFSYTEGIGTRNIEHIDYDMTGDAKLYKIDFHDGYNRENINYSMTASANMIYGLSAVPVSAENVEDDDGNWGTKIKIKMDYPVTGGAFSEFKLVDSNQIEYTSVNFEVNDTEIIVEFIDFNLAGLADSLTVIYTSGTLLSPATITESFEITFVPENLDPPQVDPPEVVSIYNL